MEIDPEVTDEERKVLARERIHPDDRHLSDDALARAIEEDGSFSYDQRLVLPSGERLMVVTGEVAREDRGRIFRGTLRDVTEWRRAQHESAHGRLALEAMQLACLPAELPRAAGWEFGARYRPAHEQDRLGGDWYDAFELPGGRIGLVVGDVTGHGLSAAAVMSQLRNALRAFASGGESPGAVLDAVARFQVQSRIESFATCLYAVVEPADGSFTWARAGHPPPLIVSGGAPGDPPWRAPEGGGGPPLGFPAAAYAEQHGAIPPGGVLVLYTDGLVEERSVTIDVGIAVLGDLVVQRAADPMSELVQHALDDLGAHRTYIDDVCLLVARRTPR